MFEKAGLKDYVYETYPIENLSELETLIKSKPELCGLNVTKPHKIGVMYYLDEIDEKAKAIDAVNCIKVIKKKPLASVFSGELPSMQVKLVGYNTDWYGFEQSLKPLLKKEHTKALVLGSGGAARAVCFVLHKMGIHYNLVSRKKTRKHLAYSDLNERIIHDHLLIINTTPLGMYPEVDQYPDIPYEFITKRHLLYDLIYNPTDTVFLKKGQERGASIKNGLEMLDLQALRSWEIWNED